MDQMYEDFNHLTHTSLISCINLPYELGGKQLYLLSQLLDGQKNTHYKQWTENNQMQMPNMKLYIIALVVILTLKDKGLSPASTFTAVGHALMFYVTGF